VEAGEKLEEAAARELHEETGMTARFQGLLWLVRDVLSAAALLAELFSVWRIFPFFALRDFPEAVMEAVLMEQPVLSDIVLLARTEFHIDGTPVGCGLVFLPDAASVAALLPPASDSGAST
jgi:8-oxo-dGTP pyrophosphatase MutT (NUDIX family)